MSYVRDTAIVLKAEPFREQDTWVTLYGRAHGKLVAVARGSRRMSAKSLGHLEPFSEVEVMIAKGAAFDKLAVARVVRPRLEMRSRLTGASVAGAFVDLMERLTRPAFADEQVYLLLLKVLDLCGQIKEEVSATRGQVLLSAASLKLVDLLGFGPSLHECARCRGTLEQAWLVAESSGFVCGSCARKAHGRVHGPLPERTDAFVRFMRIAPLGEILRVTASRDLLSAAVQTIEMTLSHTPLSSPPHGAATVHALLS